MIFLSSSVVCTCRFDFVGEVAEVVGFVVEGYRSGPFFAFFVPMDSFVFRGLVLIAVIFHSEAKPKSVDVAPDKANLNPSALLSSAFFVLKIAQK